MANLDKLIENLDQLEKLTGKKVMLKEFDAKDEQRISDIVARGNGDVEKIKQLAQSMANKITDPIKAYERGRAAENENYHDVAEIFFNRADALGNPEPGIKKQNADLKAKADAEAAGRKDFQQTALATANPRDIERVKELKAKGGKTSEGIIGLIKDPTKAYNRYLAATQEFGENDWITRAFLRRAVELQHPEAVRIAGEADKSSHEVYKVKSEQARARARLKVDAFIKVFKSRYPDFTTSITSSNPNHSYSGLDLYIIIGDPEGKLSKGLQGLGDRRAMSGMHQGLRTLATKFGGHYYNDYGKPYVGFSGK
jgi:hypothetical protein